MATSKRDIKYGAAQAKVTDDDMLRTGYINGTPLEAGKIADSHPVDLFSDARRVAEATANTTDASSRPQAGKIADSEPVDLFADARLVGEANADALSQQPHQGMGESTGGGRYMGRQT